MLSYITPPVALAAVAASVIAGSKQMETAFTAMRLGSIKFVLPFILVLTPALILRGDSVPLMILTISAVSVAVVLMAAGFEGYLYGVGVIGPVIRGLLFIGAAGFLYPNPQGYAIAAVGTVVVYGAVWYVRRRQLAS
jgi:TRAP-type uncharacterized transport system fused permease subunit